MSEWRRGRDSNPPLNVSPTTYRATDGTFRRFRHCKTVVMAGEWQVVGVASLWLGTAKVCRLIRNFFEKIADVSRDRLWIIKRVYPFQFAVTNLHAVEDLIHAMDCLHFKNRGDIFSLNNVLLDLSAFDGWQNTCQESDYGVPPA